MGSSSDDDYSTPPQQPTPPNGVQPFGSSVPYQPHYINFLGDTNRPSTGLTPAMLAEINAMNGPARPPAVDPTQTPQTGAPGGAQFTPEMREGLARLMAGAPQKQQPGIGRSNVHWVGPGGAGPSYGQGNRSGWGGSAGGH